MNSGVGYLAPTWSSETDDFFADFFSFAGFFSFAELFAAGSMFSLLDTGVAACVATAWELLLLAAIVAIAKATAVQAI